MTEVDFVLLADHAEVVNGKLYVMGAGWNRIARGVPVAMPGQPDPPPPAPNRFAIVTSVIVDWNETSERLPLSIGIETLDGQELMHVEGRLEAGRPPGAMKGAPIRTIMAHPLLMSFPAPGEYAVRVRLLDRPAAPGTDRAERFEVVDQPMFMTAAPPPQQT